ncbi:MAG: lipocalin-like domain-containing protein [Candidatus Azobacteroides sp.]|nr:lipocalin-like domain-containing protein [Candidatus Azobacteroides sp.]
MKKCLLLGIILIPFLISCLDANLPNVNGMWQLKTIQDENGETQKVDTIFYSFQRQAIFSCTILNGDTSNYSDPTVIVYGYIDFPAKDKLHIQLDKMYENLPYQEMVLWKGMQTEYDIVRLSSKELILRQDEKKYNFVKF